MATERLGNLGYLMMGKETTKGTPVIPAIAIPIYKESFNTMLNHVGLYLDTNDTSTGRAAPERAYFGATLFTEGNRLMVRNVRAGTPAYEQGINANDEIVALDGMRVNLESFDARLSEKKPGDRITLTLFRNDDLRTFDIRLGGRAVAPYRILPVPNPGENQRQSYQKWLGGNL